ncbi:MAG: GNAT family N-acetyltransferase [Bacteroidales bacterium]|nr:GNAT family N-acetyltransferase [Bacteroidales bacterium]
MYAPQNKYILQAIQLWQECFGDGREWIEDYFSRFDAEKNLKYICLDGKLISMLMCCSYTWIYYRFRLKFVYIAGVSTQKDERKRDFASSLIRKTLTDLYYEGNELCGLICANEGLMSFYSRFGFSSACSSKQGLFSVDKSAETQDLNLSAEEINIERYLDFLKNFPSDRRVEHTKETLALYNSDYYKPYAFFKGQSLHTVLIGAETENCFQIIDLRTCEEKELNQVFTILERRYNKDIRYIFHSETADNQINLQMLRLINAEKIIEIFAKENPNLDLSFCLKDGIIKENNYRFTIHKGSLTKESYDTAIEPFCDNLVDIKDLCNFLLSGSYHSLMNEK